MSRLSPPFAAMMSDIALCIAFYTRVPIKAVTMRSFAMAQWAAPIAGMVVGITVGLALLLFLVCGIPAGVAAALALALGILLTGALHEDGLADVADGFGGGRTRIDKLAIMKDSRIGTYGALALIVSLIVRWSALSALAQAQPYFIVAALVAAHGASRGMLPLFMCQLPPARPGGVSDRLGSIDPRTALAALAISAVALLPTLGISFILISLLLLGLFFLAMEKLARQQIGGQTGDVLGALQQSCEMLLLVLASAFLV